MQKETGLRASPKKFFIKLPCLVILGGSPALMTFRRYLFSALSLLLAACSTPEPQTAQLKPGMTRAEVQATCGVPLSKTVRKDGRESWDYDFQYSESRYESYQTMPTDTGVAMDRSTMPSNFSASTSRIITTTTHRASVDFSREGRVESLGRGTTVINRPPAGQR